MSRLGAAAVLLLALVAAPVRAGKAPDPELLRLQAQVQALDDDPALAELAGVARLQARQALQQLQAARGRDRAHALYLAQRRVEVAEALARTELLGQQSAQLDRERDRILLEASRRDAERARREADEARRQTLAREEEAQRLAERLQVERLASQQSAAEATAEAAQARKLAEARGREAELARKEAELAAAVVAGVDPAGGNLPPMRRSGARTIYTLDGNSFGSGRASLAPAARASLERLARVLPARGMVHVNGYTDSAGDATANLVLSQQRAEAVRFALQVAGVAPGRLTAVGRGEANPVADNGSAAGRARNRRVEIVLE